MLSVLPLDTFVEDFAMRMEIVGDPVTLPDPAREVQVEIDRAEGRARPMLGVERFAFYEAAKGAYAVIQPVSGGSMAASSFARVSSRRTHRAATGHMNSYNQFM